MGIDRRTALKSLGLAGAALAGAAVPAAARAPKRVPADAVGLLFDATLCIGCQACTVACREANGIAVADPQALWDATPRLSANNKTVIKLLAEDGRHAFFKMQCMHCVDPACVSACMLGSLQKREFGAVTWDQDRCVGCRYCQVACPFNVPAFEWSSNTPRIVKCELCRHRLVEGGEPACTEVCPRAAVIYGPRAELLEEAHRRLAEAPRRYHPKVYGETDGGGTQVLCLSPAGVPFERLGLPDLGETPVPSLAETVQHTIYKGFVAPVALYAALGAVIWRNRRAAARENGGEVDS
jgi:Fe-S-cluster-containing dehydrogenase component